MGIAMDKIHQSLLDNPRPIKIIYYNPKHSEILNECSWLRRNDKLSFKTLTTMEASRPLVEFYENI